MVSKIALALVLGIMSVGCISANDPNKTVLSLDDVIGFVGSKLADTAATVQNLEGQLAANTAALEEARNTVASLEAIVGPADTDNDGEISVAEAEAFYARATMSPDPRAKELATESDVWKKLGLLVGAAAAARKLGHHLPPQLQWLTMFFGSPEKKKVPPATPTA
jgi:hypothetical protein